MGVNRHDVFEGWFRGYVAHEVVLTLLVIDCQIVEKAELRTTSVADVIIHDDNVLAQSLV